MNEIKKAREVIYKATQEDPGFRNSYVANIAMLIYDDQMAGAKNYSIHPPPTDLDTVEGCNSIANKIIELIFSS